MSLEKYILLIKRINKKDKAVFDSMNDFLEMSLYNAKIYFFSNSFFEKKVILDLLIGHYIDIPKWKKICNNGFVIVNSPRKSDNWLEYKEKFTGKRMIVSYDGRVKVKKKDVVLLEEEKLAYESICRIKEIISLSDEAEKMLLDYLILINHEGYERIFHPMRRENFAQREIVIKILILFCLLCGGMSAGQVIHIANMLQEFEMSSELACLAIEKAVQIEEKNQIIVSMVKELSEDAKEYTLRDVIYLFELGNVELEEEEKILQIVRMAFEIDEEKLEKYSCKFRKEYINE